MAQKIALDRAPGIWADEPRPSPQTLPYPPVFAGISSDSATACCRRNYTKSLQIRIFLLRSARRVGQVALRLKIVVSSVRFRVSPSGNQLQMGWF